MRFEGTSLTCNADMGPTEIHQYCQLDDTCQSLMRSAMQQMDLSARAYHRVIKLGRTIADLAEEEEITPAHLAEALQYRPKGMMV
jgi:magnesium chelatase family protein